MKKLANIVESTIILFMLFIASIFPLTGWIMGAMINDFRKDDSTLNKWFVLYVLYQILIFPFIFILFSVG